MPIIKEIHIEKGLLLLWEIVEELDWLKQHFPFLATDKTFNSLKNIKRQKEWLAVKMMLRQIGCDDFKVYYNEKGQPQIKHHFYKNISISHSHEIAGIFLHPNKPVGLDIESLNRNFVQVQKKYLTAKEIELANQVENGNCLFWGAKEAVYKAAGIPGLHFATQIMLNFNSTNQLTATLITGTKAKTFHLNYFEQMKHLIVYLTDIE
jgi:phosphopantetheinyl transferase